MDIFNNPKSFLRCWERKEGLGDGMKSGWVCLRKAGAVHHFLGTDAGHCALQFVNFSSGLHNSTRQGLLLSLVCKEVKEKVEKFHTQTDQVRGRIYVRPEAWITGKKAFMPAPPKPEDPNLIHGSHRGITTLSTDIFPSPLHAYHGIYKVFGRKKRIHNVYSD